MSYTLCGCFRVYMVFWLSWTLCSLGHWRKFCLLICRVIRALPGHPFSNDRTQSPRTFAIPSSDDVQLTAHGMWNPRSRLVSVMLIREIKHSNKPFSHSRLQRHTIGAIQTLWDQRTPIEVTREKYFIVYRQEVEKRCFHQSRGTTRPTNCHPVGPPRGKPPAPKPNSANLLSIIPSSA